MRRLLKRYVADLIAPLLPLLARLVPVRPEAIVLRSPSAADDQAAQTIDALRRRGMDPIWLVSDTARADRVASGVRLLAAGSRRGLLAYLRAGTVVHTHGISFENDRGDRRRTFVNLWHGMPVKRLESENKIARGQTDVSFATSALHRRNLSATWGAHVHIHETGLPRNDVLLRPAPPAAREVAAGRPLVVWLPTFREVHSVYRHTGNHMSSVDGTDFGNAAQFPGATPDRLETLARELDVTLVVKPHPMAAGAPPRHNGTHLRYVTDASLLDIGVRLYELLAAADVLVTDYSSAWIDFLLTKRPIVFTAADQDAYAGSRGFYADVVSDPPGPVVTDVDGLTLALKQVVTDPNAWAEQRSAALALHHRHHDASSADRVAQVVADLLSAPGPTDERPTVRSFDVFDTVLTRRVGDPRAVFPLVAQRLSTTDEPLDEGAFVRARAEAERTLRPALGRHATLLEIHQDVARRLNLVSDPARGVLAEEQVEREVCVAVPGAAALVAAARSLGEVVFVSDTPHSETFVLELLCAAGVAVDGDRVFGSAQRGTSKSDGGLFDTVREATSPSATFVHTGDNRRSDVAAARSEQWAAQWRPRGELNRYERALETYASSTAGAASWLAGASRLARLEDAAAPDGATDAPVAAVASGVLGPTLVGYALWAAAQARRRGVRRLYFVARDGQVMFEAARHVLARAAPEIECRYLYGSRQAWVFGATALAPELRREWVTVKPEFTARAMLQRVNVEPAEAEALTGSDLFAPDRLDRVMPVADREALRAMLLDGVLAQRAQAAALADADLAVEYLRQEGVVSDDPVALVDAGWTGATARALDVLVDAGGGQQVTHLFMGVTRSAVDRRVENAVRLTPWLFDGWSDPGSLREIVNVNVLIEMLCAGTHGRTVGYRRGAAGRLEPVLTDVENTPPLQWGLEPMQRIALRTAELAAEHLDARDQHLDWAAPARGLLRMFWMHPTPAEARAWGTFPWEDEVWPPFRPIAERVTTRSVLTRLMHGDRSLRPNNTWRSGSATLSPQPWRGVLQARQWQETNRDRLRRLPRRARLELRLRQR